MHISSINTEDKTNYSERILVAQIAPETDRQRIINGTVRSQIERSLITGSYEESPIKEETEKSYSGRLELETKELQTKFSAISFIEETAPALVSNDKKIRAEACSKVFSVAERFPDIISEDIISRLLQNLTNEETAEISLFYELRDPSKQAFLRDMDIMRISCTAYLYAKSALVSLGERSIPHLKQALIEGNQQMRERVLEVLYAISLKNPEFITDDFIPLLCKYASDEGCKAKDIIEVLIKANRTSTSQPAMESEDKE